MSLLNAPSTLQARPAWPRCPCAPRSIRKSLFRHGRLPSMPTLGHRALCLSGDIQGSIPAGCHQVFKSKPEHFGTLVSIVQELCHKHADRWFTELRSQGMEPNQACALALKVAAGAAEPPISVGTILSSIQAAAEACCSSQREGITANSSEASQYELVSTQDAAAKVYRFFSSPDSIQASFWSALPAASTVQGTESTSSPAPMDELQSNASAGRTNAGEGVEIKGTAPEHVLWPEQVPTETQGSISAHATQPGAAATAQQQQDVAMQQVQQLPAGGVQSLGVGSNQITAAGLTSMLGLDNQEGAALQGENHVDADAAHKLYATIVGLKSQRVTTSLISACERLLVTSTSLPAAANPGLLRQLLVLLLNPLLEDLDHAGLLTNICVAMVALVPDQLKTFEGMLADVPAEHMRRLVVCLQQYITVTLYQQQAITHGVQLATKALGVLYRAHDVHSHKIAPPSSSVATSTPAPAPVAYTEFYNDAVNSEDFNLKEDFRRWKSLYRTEFSFCAHPYMYDPASKARILQMECQLAQYNELHTALFRGLFGAGSMAGDTCPFLVLKIRRGAHLIQDTLVQVHHAKEQGTLRKPLKVKFVGEEGVDEGGVQKEFFQLLVRELFNPDYGMFVYDDRVRLHWFRPSHLEMDTEFELTGILVGLAIYNSHILEFSFPLVLYKLLVGAQPALNDLQELHPDIYNSLSKLLHMSAEEVDACGLNFSVDVEYAFGQREQVELIPGQGNMPVTTSNRQMYVQAYTQHLLQGCVQRQWSSFQRGFLRLCEGTALSWFRPEELELLICGSPQLDLAALQAATLYDDGYSNDSMEVQWFWEVAHNLSTEQQKRLLAFVTGSDRVPIKGLSALNPPFVISRMGGDPDRLPTAHTCFNHLLLPAYSTKERLAQKLVLALDNAEGFGLM